MKANIFIYRCRVFILLLTLFVFLYDSNLSADVDRYTMARDEMVQYQIRKRGIKDQNVLRAMSSVPRHEFVRKGLWKNAYEDRPLPIGYGQTISQPYIVAYMTELLGVDQESRVLEVGTGSGYQAAILAGIVKEVYTVEIVAPLYQRSQTLLERLGYKNIQIKNADGYFGWESQAPFDAIIVTCASDFIPPPLIKQLKKGGVMCIPVGPPFKIQHLILVKKEMNGEITTQIMASVRFVPLVRDSQKQ